MRIYQVVVGAVVVGTVTPVLLHHHVYGVWNVHQMGLAFFLWLNTIIALWEICLFLRIDRIAADYARFKIEYVGRPLDRVKDFFFTPITFAQIFSPTTWSEIWSSYALFDDSYADRKSFGYWIDVGNGFEQFFVRDVHDRMRFERGADALLRALDLQRAGDDAAHGAHLAPFLGQLVVAPGGRNRGEALQVHRGRAVAVARQPRFLGREA